MNIRHFVALFFKQQLALAATVNLQLSQHILYFICILTGPPVLPDGTFNQHLPESTSIGQMQHPKGCCMELGKWPIKVQLGSTNSKGLPVLFQGSHQDLFLNNHH